MSVSRQFKTQTGQYKIKIKSGCWQGYDTARLEISVGQPYHEGEKFKATISWAAERFPNVVLLVNDSLQRYNLMFENGLPEESAERISCKQGSEWMRRNYPVAYGCQAICWNEWKARAEYPETSYKTRNLFDRNERFRTSLTDAISEVWERRSKCHPAYSPERKEEFFNLSIDYLLEETAVLAMAYKEFPGVSVYPGSFLEMWSMFVDTAIEDAPEGLKNAHCVRIDFAKNKNADLLPSVTPA